MHRASVALFAGLGVLLGPTLAFADNSACWGDIARPDITCSNLSEPFLDGLQSASRTQVIQAMNARGVEREAGALHFLGNDTDRGAYNGDVNLTFMNGKVAVISAVVSRSTGDAIQSQIRYIWNVSTEGCSDFPGSFRRCNP